MSDTNVHRVVGNLLVGTGHLFVDTVNNQIGVNTSTPSAALDVASGDLKVGSDITIGNSGTITAANFSGNGSGLSGINSDSGSWVNGASSNVHLAVSTDKVGIATATPMTKLDIAYNAAAPAIVFSDTTNSRFQTGIGSLNVSNEGQRLDFYTGDSLTNGTLLTNTPRMCITGTGNVGVGTSSPGRLLEVYTGNGTVPGLRLRRGAGAAYTDLHHAAVNVPNTGDLEGLAIITSDGNQTTQEVMRICGNGHVGIGTSSPSHMLHIETPTGTASNYVRIGSYMNDGSSQSISGIEFATNPQFFNLDNIQRVPGQIRSGFYDGGSADWTDAYISFLTPNDPSSDALAHALTIRGGNVGVGTSSPGATLDVAAQHGDIASPMVHFRANRDGASNGDGNVLLLENSGNRSDVELLECKSSAGTRFVVKANGDVDIKGNVTTGPVLYVGTNTNNETAKTIYFGGTIGDNAYDHCVIERRVWQTGTEKQELLLFSGNDGETTAGPDRIRLKGAQILFDTLNNSTDRTTENTKMTVKSDGVVINSGTLRKPGNPGCRVTMTSAQFTLGLHSVYPIVYDSEYHDTGNDYNTSTGKFTCPVAGKYLCIHMMTTRSTRTRVAISEVKLYHNTSETARQFQDITQDSAVATNVINCAAGDTLYAGIYNASSSNEFNGGPEYGSQFIVEFLG